MPGEILFCDYVVAKDYDGNVRVTQNSIVGDTNTYATREFLYRYKSNIVMCVCVIYGEKKSFIRIAIRAYVQYRYHKN